MRPLYGIRTSRVEEVFRLAPYEEPNPTSHYMRGWLAGAFDAEGSDGGGAMLRIHQRISNRPFWDTTRHFLTALDVPYAIEEKKPSKLPTRERMGSFRIRRFASQLRFIAMTQPVLRRKWAYPLGTRIRGAVLAAPVLSKRDASFRRMISLQTSTGTLIQGGFLSHDCRAVSPPRYEMRPRCGRVVVPFHGERRSGIH
jgi:hypothetical protein